MKTKTSLMGNSMNRSPVRLPFLHIPLVLALAWFALAPRAGATCREGCLTNNNTVLGDDALVNNTGGENNTATGFVALATNDRGSNNTATGAYALALNDTGSNNTATGFGALNANPFGRQNTATGAFALANDDNQWRGNNNTADGFGALNSFRDGNNNIALGSRAGESLRVGSDNIDIGNVGVAIESNTIRIGDPAIHQTVIIGGIPAGGLAAILFDYNSGGITIGVGGPVTFNQTALQVGTAVTKTDNATFTLNKVGVYRVTYTLRTAIVSLLAQTQVQVNGTGIGPTAALVAGGVPLND